MEIEMITGNKLFRIQKHLKRYTSTPDAGCTRLRLQKRPAKRYLFLEKRWKKKSEVKKMLLVIYGIL